MKNKTNRIIIFIALAIFITTIITTLILLNIEKARIGESNDELTKEYPDLIEELTPGDAIEEIKKDIEMIETEIQDIEGEFEPLEKEIKELLSP